MKPSVAQADVVIVVGGLAERQRHSEDEYMDSNEFVNPFLGEIRLFPYTYAPKDWAACDGSVVPIEQNPSLFSLLGNAFGGDGQTNFGLPDLRKQVPPGASPGRLLHCDRGCLPGPLVTWSRGRRSFLR